MSGKRELVTGIHQSQLKSPALATGLFLLQPAPALLHSFNLIFKVTRLSRGGALLSRTNTLHQVINLDV